MEFSNQKVEYLKYVMISWIVSVLRNVLLFRFSLHFVSKKHRFLAMSLFDRLPMDGVHLMTDSRSST